MKNWMTTAAGLATAAIIAAADAVKNGGFTWQGVGTAVGIAVLGYLAKDRNVRGGTVQQ